MYMNFSCVSKMLCYIVIFLLLIVESDTNLEVSLIFSCIQKLYCDYDISY